MNVSIFVRCRMLRFQYVQVVELLGTFRSVFQHCAHGRIAVDIGILPFKVVVFGIKKGQPFINLHQSGVHFPYAGSFCPVEDILLGGSGMPVFNQNLFHGILDFFHSGHLSVHDQFNVLNNFFCKGQGCVIVISACSTCCLEYGIRYLFNIKGHFTAITFSNLGNHRWFFLSVFNFLIFLLSWVSFF